MTAMAWDESGVRVGVPNGTQVRLSNFAIATATLSGDQVTVRALAVGRCDVWLTKGAVASNLSEVNVRSVPVPSTIDIAIVAR